MHRPQRSPFVCLASFALSTLASCTLTAEDYQPGLTSARSIDEETDPLEPAPAASAPNEATEVDEGAESAGSESPQQPGVPLAPSDPVDDADGSAMPCASSSAGCDRPTPDDGVVDCGGEPCPEPPEGGCETADDCESGICAAGLCQPPSCTDAFQNADEAGVDCGGSACVPCPCSYGAPELLGDPNYPGNFLYSPSLSPDGLTLYFGLYVAGAPTETIAFSTRASLAGAFGLGNLLPAAVNASIEGTPRIGADDLTLYFYSERAGGLGGRDIYRAQRSASGAAFDLITNLTELNSSGMDHLPWVSADGLSLYFSSDRAGDLDIHRATRASIDAAWQPPERVTELNTTALEGGMTLSSDEGEIFFASNRLGTSDLFRAVRAPGQTTFGAPEPLAALNSAAEDTDPALSPDGTALYFASTREGTDSRIWRVSRSCP